MEQIVLEYIQYDNQKDIENRYLLTSTMLTYLYRHEVLDTACADQYQSINYSMQFGLVPVFDKLSIQILKSHRPRKNYTVMFLNRLGSHAQLLYLDEEAKTFSILDPEVTRDHSVSEEIEKILPDYRYVSISCLTGPQSITRDSFCQIWTVFIAKLICQGYSYYDVYTFLSSLPKDTLASIIRGYIGYLYNVLVDEDLVPAAQVLVDFRLDVINKKILTPYITIHYFNEMLNDLALSGGKGETLANNIIDEIYLAGIPNNPIYLQLKSRKLTPLAFKWLLNLSEQITESTSMDTYQRLLLTIPYNKEYDLKGVYTLFSDKLAKEANFATEVTYENNRIRDSDSTVLQDLYNNLFN